MQPFGHLRDSHTARTDAARGVVDSEIAKGSLACGERSPGTFGVDNQSSSRRARARETVDTALRGGRSVRVSYRVRDVCLAGTQKQVSRGVSGELRTAPHGHPATGIDDTDV